MESTCAPLFLKASAAARRSGPLPTTTTSFPLIGYLRLTMACNPPAPKTPGRTRPGNGSIVLARQWPRINLFQWISHSPAWSSASSTPAYGIAKAEAQSIRKAEDRRKRLSHFRVRALDGRICSLRQICPPGSGALFTIPILIPLSTAAQAAESPAGSAPTMTIWTRYTRLLTGAG